MSFPPKLQLADQMDKQLDAGLDLDEITSLVAKLCEVPYCLVTVMEGSRLWLKSKHGWTEDGEGQAEDLFCRQPSVDGEIFEVPDTLADPHFAGHPLVEGPKRIRFYAAAPFWRADGIQLGNLCVLDDKPRQLNATQRQVLSVLARQIFVRLDYARTMADLEARNADLNETARIARVGKWRRDIDSQELEWSEAAYEIFGVEPDQFGGHLQSFLAAIHPADLAAVLQANEEVLAGKPLDMEHRVRRPDGSVRWVHERGELIRDAAGENLYVAGTVQDITDRKVLARDLEVLFETSNDLICVADQHGKFLRVNPAFERTLGWNREELLAKSYWELIVPEDREATSRRMLEPPEGRRRFENRLTTRDGGVRTIAWADVPTLEDHTIYAIGRDVTEERELQRNLEAVVERLQETLESITDAFLALDRNWRVTYLNQRAVELLGRTREELVGRDIWDVFPEAVGSKFYLEYHRAFDTGKPAHFEEYFGPLSKWFEIRAFPSIPGLGIYFRDISAERSNTEHLRLLETCLRHQNDLVFITEMEPIDESGPQIVFVNDAFIRRTGYTREEVMGKSPRFLRGERTSINELERIRTALQACVAVRAELVNYTKDGEPFWLDLDLVPVADDEGVYRHFIGIGRDIADRKAAEAALQASMERYQLFFDRNPLPLWVYDQETWAFLAVNEAAILKYGYSREEFLALTIRDIRPAAELPALEDAVSRMEPGPRSAGTWKHLTKDGRILIVDIHSQAISFEGRAARIILPLDITDRLKLEEQLQQAQKMETIGRLAGGIAHDFNNLLTVINGYAQILLARCAEEGKNKQIFRQILQSGERAAKLTAQLLAFSRKQVLQPKMVAVNSLIEGLKPVLQRLIREDIEMVWALGGSLGLVSIDPSQFEQVILNLAVNARDAMPQGGWLTIETTNVFVEEAYRQLHPEVIPGRYVIVSVSDTGHGMAPEVLRHVFDPFFTTKAPGVGTGLGLATVYGVVKQSGGHISVYSETGVGSRFKVYLPIVDGEVTEIMKDDSISSPELQGTETVLLVEDDDAVREYASGALRSLGYQVVEASNGADAILVSERHAGEIDLLLTDVVMPKMSGRDLAEFLCGRRPALKVLFMSGYTENAIVHQGVLEQGLNFMAKPFSPNELAQKVRAVLAAPRRSKSVMILDDEPDVREFFKDALESMGYQTTLCASGKEAMRQLRLIPVDLLITDLIMPGQEGIETISMVKKEFPHLKVIAISGYGGGDYLKLARALGANQTLSKPLDIDLLCDTVKAMIG